MVVGWWGRRKKAYAAWVTGAIMVLDAGQHVNSCMKQHGEHREYLLDERVS